MKLDDGRITVVMKAVGKSNTHLQFREEYDGDGSDSGSDEQQKGVADITVGEQVFAVVVRFADNFRLFGANAIEIAVGTGDGQHHEGLRRQQHTVIAAASVAGSQHVITSVPARRARNTAYRSPLVVKGAVDLREARYYGGPARGTITVLVTRGRSSPSGRFEPLNGGRGTGQCYVFEFRPHPLSSVDPTVDITAGYVAAPDVEYALMLDGSTTHGIEIEELENDVILAAEDSLQPSQASNTPDDDPVTDETEDATATSPTPSPVKREVIEIEDDSDSEVMKTEVEAETVEEETEEERIELELAIAREKRLELQLKSIRAKKRVGTPIKSEK